MGFRKTGKLLYGVLHKRKHTMENGAIHFAYHFWSPLGYQCVVVCEFDKMFESLYLSTPVPYAKT